jgi:DNA-binding transcriptional LysR family regulator
MALNLDNWTSFFAKAGKCAPVVLIWDATIGKPQARAVACIPPMKRTVKQSLAELSWDDLRIIKAIGEHGSLMNAALALDVNHSTLSRRLSNVEDALGMALFERRRTGYVPTEAGGELVALGHRMERDILGVARQVAGHAKELTGALRITTSDALLQDFLTPIIKNFQAAHRGVRVDVIVGNQTLNLARGDSDIAFRATLSVPDNLCGRKMATIAWAIYGRRDSYCRRDIPQQALYEENWVAYGKGLSGLKAHGFINERVRAQNIRYLGDSVYGVAAAIRSGIGVGLLPCMHGELDRELIRIGPVEKDVYDELWLLTHPDIRKSPRISAFMSHCGEAIAKQRDFIEGKKRNDARAA